MPPIAEFEGPWEEIVARGAEFAGHRVRLTLLPFEEPETDSTRRERITDVEGWLASLPTCKGAEDLWDAVAENRTMRRALEAERA
jgi:hypothetical protein